MKGNITILLLFFCVNFFACLPEDPDYHKKELQKPMQNYLEVTGPEKSSFMEKLSHVKIGDTYDKVTNMLGRPFDEATIRGKKIDDPIRGTIVTYYLKKVHENIVNEKKDEYISFVFDNEKKLVRAYTNYAGLSLPSGLTSNTSGPVPARKD